MLQATFPGRGDCNVSRRVRERRARHAPGDLPRTRGLQPCRAAWAWPASARSRRPSPDEGTATPAASHTETMAKLQATFPGRGDCNDPVATHAPPSPELQATFPGRGDCNYTCPSHAAAPLPGSRRPSPDEGTATGESRGGIGGDGGALQATFPGRGDCNHYYAPGSTSWVLAMLQATFPGRGDCNPKTGDVAPAASALQATFPGRGDCNAASTGEGVAFSTVLQATFPGRGDCNQGSPAGVPARASRSRRPSPDEGTATARSAGSETGTACAPGDLPRTRGLQLPSQSSYPRVSTCSRRPSPDEGTATTGGAGAPDVRSGRSRRPSPDEGTATSECVRSEDQSSRAPGDLPRTRGLQLTEAAITSTPPTGLQATFPGRGDCNAIRAWYELARVGSSRRPSPDEGTATRRRGRSRPRVPLLQATFPGRGDCNGSRARLYSAHSRPLLQATFPGRGDCNGGGGSSKSPFRGCSRRPSPDEGTATARAAAEANDFEQLLQATFPGRGDCNIDGSMHSRTFRGLQATFPGRGDCNPLCGFGPPHCFRKAPGDLPRTRGLQRRARLRLHGRRDRSRRPSPDEGTATEVVDSDRVGRPEAPGDLPRTRGLQRDGDAAGGAGRADAPGDLLHRVGARRVTGRSPATGRRPCRPPAA